jgi:cytochrome c biogenesis protein CcdA
MATGSVVLAFVAGAVSVLSPCVLPILPVVLGAAASEHKLGPVALAAGLAVSFVIAGLFVATIGYSIGLDADALRYVAAALIAAMGAVLILPSLQARLALASGPIAGWTNRHVPRVRAGGLFGQFAIGLLLGVVWSPCVGPTLGAASLLAAQGRALPQVGVIMFAFGVGASIPLLALGLFSRDAMLRWRHHILAAGQGVKAALGFGMVAIGALVLAGLDKRVEAALVVASPQWLTELTTRF